MRIGYPCINRSIGCSSSRTFRLASYSDERLVSTVTENLSCLEKILVWNHDHDIRFFRISSDIIPFASHPICTFPWKEHFSDDLGEIGDFIKKSGIRISMHPDQFIILNSPDKNIVSRSVAELLYHANVLDGMGLDTTAKIQLHVGGVYGDPQSSISRFILNYNDLDTSVKHRLVIENDDQRYTAGDCLQIYENTGIPVLFDVFHHICNNSGQDPGKMLRETGKTWKGTDGIPMVDYSSQHPEKRRGSHADHIDGTDFLSFLQMSRTCDRDIMLEIKDKESSALKAVSFARADPRFV